MPRFKLTAKTRKGRNRIHEAGTDMCFLLKQRNEVAFSPDSGPWLFVRFDDADDRHDRWLHAKHDPDFTLEDVDP